jgi:hypothetical protein
MFKNIIKIFQRLFFLTLLFIPVWGCGGSGTEVVDPGIPNPAKRTTFTSEEYKVSLKVSPGWTYVEDGPDAIPTANAFEDIDPDTITVAEFYKNDSRFTLFFSVLDQGQTLLDFVRDRHPTGDVSIDSTTSMGITVEVATYIDDNPGPNGGFFFDVYVLIDGQCLWMRVELVGSPQERQQLLKEINAMIESIQFIPSTLFLTGGGSPSGAAPSPGGAFTPVNN